MDKLTLLFLAGLVALANAKAVADTKQHRLYCHPGIILNGCNICYYNEKDGKLFCTARVCFDETTEIVDDTTIRTEIVDSFENIEVGHDTALEIEYSPIKICNPGDTYHFHCVHCQCNEEGSDFACTTNADCPVKKCVHATWTINGFWGFNCHKNGTSIQYICVMMIHTFILNTLTEYIS